MLATRLALGDGGGIEERQQQDCGRPDILHARAQLVLGEEGEADQMAEKQRRADPEG